MHKDRPASMGRLRGAWAMRGVGGDVAEGLMHTEEAAVYDASERNCLRGFACTCFPMLPLSLQQGAMRHARCAILTCWSGGGSGRPGTPRGPAAAARS